MRNPGRHVVRLVGFMAAVGAVVLTFAGGGYPQPPASRPSVGDGGRPIFLAPGSPGKALNCAPRQGAAASSPYGSLVDSFTTTDICRPLPTPRAPAVVGLVKLA